MQKHGCYSRASPSIVSWAGPPLAARPMCSSVGIRGYTQLRHPRVTTLTSVTP
jgi:hypothetical protein